MEVEPPGPGDLLPPERPERAAVGPPDELAAQVAVEERVLAVPGARFPPRRLGSEQLAHAVPVEQDVRRLRVAQGDDAGLVAKRLTDGDALFPCLGELRPGSGDWVVKPEHAAIGEHEDTERGHGFRHRIDVDERRTPEPLTAPKIGDNSTVGKRDISRAGLAELVEAVNERVADTLETT